jgi:hypothetical protein
MRKIPDIKTMKMVMTFWKTINNPSAGKVDMYLLNDDETGEGLISVGVPHGRKDIAEFVLKSCDAGQKVLNYFNISNIEDFKP